MARSLGRELVCWLGGYLIIAVLLISYFRAPLLPIVLAGAVTFIVTGIRYLRRSKDSDGT